MNCCTLVENNIELEEKWIFQNEDKEFDNYLFDNL